VRVHSRNVAAPFPENLDFQPQSRIEDSGQPDMGQGRTGAPIDAAGAQIMTTSIFTLPRTRKRNKGLGARTAQHLCLKGYPIAASRLPNPGPRHSRPELGSQSYFRRASKLMEKPAPTSSCASLVRHPPAGSSST
jgi:hypothetical protein